MTVKWAAPLDSSLVSSAYNTIHSITMGRSGSYLILLLAVSCTLHFSEAGILSTSPARVLAQPAESVQLQCHYEVSPSITCNGRYLFWYHGNNVMVTNNTVPKNPKYSARLDHQEQNDSVQCTYTLNIKGVTPQEAGNYACIFIWYEGYFHYEQVMSQVLVVKRPRPMYPQCSKKVTVTKSGAKSLAFVCESEQSSEDGLTLQWRNGNQVLPTTTNETNGIMRSTYLMNGTKMIPNDTHEYVCEIMYNQVSLEQSCIIQATMGVVINSLYHIKENPEDSYATFTCQVNMSIPGIDFKRTWYFHGAKIDPHDVNDRFLVDSHAGELHVRNITKSDSHEHIQCLVTSILGNGSADALMIVSSDETDSIFNKNSGAQYNTTLIAALIAGAFSLVILVNVLLWFVKGKSKQANARLQRNPRPPSINSRPPVHPELIPYDTEDEGNNIYQYADTPYMSPPKCSLSNDFPYLNTGVTKLADSQKICSTEDISPYTISTGVKNDYINMNKPRPQLASEDTEEYESMYQDTESIYQETDTCTDSGRGSAYSTESTLLKSVDQNHQYYQAIRNSRPLLDEDVPVTVEPPEDRAPTLPRKEGKAVVHEYQGLDKSNIHSKDSVYMRLKQQQKHDDSHIYENIA